MTQEQSAFIDVPPNMKALIDRAKADATRRGWDGLKEPKISIRTDLVSEPLELEFEWEDAS